MECGEKPELRARRKAWLKNLAARHRAAWLIAVRPRSLDGQKRVQTKNEVLHLEDGVVARVSSSVGNADRDAASPLLGMHVVGWADDRHVYHEYVPGTRVILWRRGSEGDDTALAMTSRVVAFGKPTEILSMRNIPISRGSTPSTRAVSSSRGTPSSRGRVSERPVSGVRVARRGA